jgi:hypothetical protein
MNFCEQRVAGLSYRYCLIPIHPHPEGPRGSPCPFHFAPCTVRPRRIDLGEQMQVAQAQHLALLAIAPASASSYYEGQLLLCRPS